MKLKSTLTNGNSSSSGSRELPGPITARRMLLLGMSAAAGLFMSGCAIDPGLSYASYSGPYYGGYGPYSGEDFIFGGVHHGWYSGEHHLYGSSFGRNEFSGARHGGGFRGAGAFHGGGGHGGGRRGR